jgi:hypothetical protein
MKKPADKTDPRYLSGVCNPIREEGDNRLIGLHGTTNTAATSNGERPGTATIYPTPPPLSPHAYENKDVTSITTRNTRENKEHTSRSLAEISHFAPGMLSAGEAQMVESAIVSNHSCDCPCSEANG